MSAGPLADEQPRLVRRRLSRDELPSIWTIDRREIVERIFIVHAGELVLRDAYFDIKGWPSGAAEEGASLMAATYDRGGAFLGVFEGPRLVAVAVVDTKALGPRGDLVQLTFLHVGRDHRRLGLGRELFEAAWEFAAGLGAAGLYVSATPSESTVGFYLHRGCTVTAEPDPELFALEPEDIHFECRAR